MSPDVEDTKITSIRQEMSLNKQQFTKKCRIYLYTGWLVPAEDHIVSR